MECENRFWASSSPCGFDRTHENLRGALAFVDAAQAASVKLPRADPGQEADTSRTSAWEQSRRPRSGDKREKLVSRPSRLSSQVRVHAADEKEKL
jgi:hypothetical protein